MANTKSAKKRAVQNERHREHNASLKSKYRTHIKKVEAAITANKKEEAVTALKESIPVIDKMVTKKISLLKENNFTFFVIYVNSQS